MKVVNHHYWRRYRKLLQYRRQNPLKEKGEEHHIIPECIDGPDVPNNLIYLSYREHYIAHYLLAKSLNRRNLWFAFNMMKRVCGGRSVLYEKARKYIEEAVSQSNTGRRHTQEAKDKMSKDRKGMVIVKDSKGNSFRVSKQDERYLNGDLVYYRTGSSHSQETKDKMRENGLKGRKICHNPYTGEWKYVKMNNELPEEWEWGSGERFKETQRNRRHSMYWYTNIDTGEWKRFGENDEIPSNFVRGRKGLSNSGHKGRPSHNKGKRLWNNGHEEVYSKDKPGEDYVLGIIPRSENERSK